jgi:hypothetical protein
MRDLHFKFVRDRASGQKYFRVGLNADGSFWSPDGHDEAIVRPVVEATIAEWHPARSAAAKRAAETRRHRLELKVYRVAQRILAGGQYGPRAQSYVCRKGLGDPPSIERGIGPECWGRVLAAITRAQAKATAS